MNSSSSSEPGPIRVAQVLAGAPFGGAENFYTRLVCALADKPGLQQRAFTRANPHRVPQLLEAGVPVSTFRFGSAVDVIGRYRYRQALRRFRPDVVLTYMGRASRLTPNGDYRLVCRLGHYYDLKSYRHADYWIGISKGICQHMIDGGIPAQRIFHIPNFADETSVEPLARDSFDTPVDRPLLLAAGRLHVNKAFDILFEALADIPDAMLWLAGDGPERGALERLGTALGVAERIRFLGWRNDIAALMRTADLFVCPSRHEGLGSIVMESWFNDCPIVATASQGPGEAIDHGDTGLLSPVDDVAALRENIVAVMNDPALGQSLVTTAKAHYNAHYAKQVIAAQYLDFFTRITA